MSSIEQNDIVRTLFGHAQSTADVLQLRLKTLHESCTATATGTLSQPLDTYYAASSIYSQPSHLTESADRSNGICLALHEYTCALIDHQEATSALTSAIKTVIVREQDRLRARTLSRLGSVVGGPAASSGPMAGVPSASASVSSAHASRVGSGWSTILAPGDSASQLLGQPYASSTTLPVNPFSTEPSAPPPPIPIRHQEHTQPESGHSVPNPAQQYTMHARPVEQGKSTLPVLQPGQHRAMNNPNYIAFVTPLPPGYAYYPSQTLPSEFYIQGIAEHDFLAADTAKKERRLAELQAEMAVEAVARAGNSPWENIVLNHKQARAMRKKEKAERKGKIAYA